MEKNYKLYMHQCPNGKMYFGITSTSVEKRWNSGRGYKNNKHLTGAINKYGWDNIEHIVLAENLTEEEAKQQEIVLIAFFDTTNQDKGYNITKGGEGANGYECSEETRKKHSESMKGKNTWMKGRKHSEETRRKMSEANKGENNPNYGKPLSNETKTKMKAKAKERYQDKTNHPNYGKHHSEETKLKISEKMKGKPQSEETKQKKSRKVRCIELDIVFSSIGEANKYFNKPNYANHICQAIKNNYRAFGYHWEYI